jgi:hypothetical protein
MVNTMFGDRRYHHSMSEHPPSGPAAAHGASGYPPLPTGFPGTQAGSPAWPSPPRRPSRWPTFLALALAVVASGLAIAGWFRPSKPPPPTHTASPSYTEQQVSDAKSRACTAFETVKKGTTLQTNLPPTDDPALANVQATHAQLSLVAGGWYLREQVDPATPPTLAADVQKLANTLLDLGANAIAGAKNADPPQAARMDDANSAFGRIEELCR